VVKMVDEEKNTVQVEEKAVENKEKEEVEVRESVEEEGKLPFPRATITKLVRKNLGKGKQIKGTVKDEMNLWVSNMIENIAGKMNSQPYTFVNYDMLKDAIAPYEEIADINKQREELNEYISKIKEDCQNLIEKIDSEDKKTAINLKLEDDKLPFPKATITNKLRSCLDEGKTIKGPVKRGLNVWLGRVVAAVSKKMDSFPYPYVDRSMFKDAVEPYEAISEIELEKERIIQQMESIKTACDILTSEVERKFRM
jgi:histone H3/H4